MTAASAAAVSERSWEVPTLRVGDMLPDPAVYPDYAAGDGNYRCEFAEVHGPCALAWDHSGDLHAAASLSGRIVFIWEETADVDSDYACEYACRRRCGPCSWD